MISRSLDPMATRTSSPPASRTSGATRKGGSGSSRSRSSGSQSRGSSSAKGRSTKSKRPAPRAVRNGPGPVYRLFSAIGRALRTFWLGVAHAFGATVRRVGHTARELEPEHRRDGVGLFLMALAVVVAASVWWRLPGGVGDTTRTVVNGSVGLLGWFVPLVLLGIGAVTMRNPESTGPVGRQVIGWGALVFGILGLVHLANGSPEGNDSEALQSAGGAIGFVVGSLALDLLQTPYVVVPIFVLLSLFGLLVVTATPVYQIPARLAVAPRPRCWAVTTRHAGPEADRAPSRRPRSSAAGPAAGSARWRRRRATTSPPRATRPTTPR